MTKNKFAQMRKGAVGEEKTVCQREKTNGGESAEKPLYGDEREAAESEKERRSYLEERLEFHAQKALAEADLPTSFAKLLCGESEEETLENIAVFKEEFMKAVEAALSEKLRGKTPQTSAAQTEFDPFLTGFGM